MKGQPIRLGALREEKWLTQPQMAELMGVTTRQYRRYELGEQEPNLAGWIFLADFFQVSLDYLVGRSTDPKHRP